MDYACNIVRLQHRNIALAVLTLTAIGFSGSTFAFSFSSWFSSNKPTQTAQASIQPLQQAQQPSQTAQAVESMPVHGHHKKHHHRHKAAQGKSQASAPIPTTPPAPLIISHPKNEVTLSGGLTISTISNGNQTVAINNTVSNTYNTSTSTNTNGMAGLGYARLFHLKHDVAITIGPGLYYTNMDQVNGTEHPYSNGGNFDTLNYHYSADSWSLLAESKLVYEKYQWQPFVTGGIGPSWNRLSSYGEVPTDPSGSATANPSVFKNNTQAQFAYEVGFGVQRIFYTDPKHNVSYRASLGYRYMNFGEGKLNPASISTTGQGIKVSTLDTNAILFGVSAVF